MTFFHPLPLFLGIIQFNMCNLLFSIYYNYRIFFTQLSYMTVFFYNLLPGFLWLTCRYWSYTF